MTFDAASAPPPSRDRVSETPWVTIAIAEKLRQVAGQKTTKKKTGLSIAHDLSFLRLLL
jgi:hypothetical protein